MSKDEFYIGYSNRIGSKTRRLLRNYVLIVLILILGVGFSFSYFQKPAANSSFDFTSSTQLTGTYHESPYPMIRISLEENTFKDILLLGFGKFGANPYLDLIKEEEGNLEGKQLTIEGNLIYYNGKTLLQIDESYKLTIDKPSRKRLQETVSLGERTVEGEVIDPKCYFGVMKPGFGKIHRSCASLCIAGGIPPVYVVHDQSGMEEYFLLTDLKGNPINADILPYIGQPSRVHGQVMKMGDWNLLRIHADEIQKLNRKSAIY